LGANHSYLASSVENGRNCITRRCFFIEKNGKKMLFYGVSFHPAWNVVGFFLEKMYFIDEDFYGRSCSDNSNPRFGYHGNACESHGLDCAV
jgi:hypothetical protein